jgi:hypothetical protein
MRPFYFLTSRGQQQVQFDLMPEYNFAPLTLASLKQGHEGIGDLYQDHIVDTIMRCSSILMLSDHCERPRGYCVLFTRVCRNSAM